MVDHSAQAADWGADESGEVAVSTGNSQGLHGIAGPNNSGTTFCFPPGSFDLMFAAADIVEHFHALIPLRQAMVTGTVICHMLGIVGSPKPTAGGEPI